MIIIPAFHPEPTNFQALFLVMKTYLFNIIPPLISDFEHGHFRIAHTIKSLRIGHALNRM